MGREWKWEEATAGAVAGVATVVALHPLDIVRTRFQADDGRNRFVHQYKSTANALLTIARTEGVKGLYAGLSPAVFGSSLAWGLYFLFYSNIKEMHQRRLGGELGPGHHLVASAEAGALVSAMTNPIFLVKTRLQLQPPNGSQQPYSGFMDAFHSIRKVEGWRGFYKGFGPSVLLVSHGALQFMAYEEGRKMAIAARKRVDPSATENSLTSLDFAVLGATSKLFALFLTYPYQVIRTRSQQRPDSQGSLSYRGGWHAFTETLKYEGVRGLYKGMVPNLLRVAPSSSITFIVYESVKKILLR
ncbi:hypothetical protein SELMODRAFT_89452 [Selaginella moellendorffii]|uniref:Folate transporter 1, chloroplastic n=1 Tax=Selaginella moellendorffii TaxID=88036 RepID=D8RBU4_SELML|nr:folate transporter 1, chloroplastic [Selaginella moellendorffii]EFJ30847.1 hypothetical protein SELMODRAFT_89452 [Selaginella moellendorffii]|eukprot:XP_002968593.1 folate transporter 1, chloroplastic [Selaginella moellendorffii]